jgi:glycosyltransferase involved in cell wall biosynthesis
VFGLPAYNHGHKLRQTLNSLLNQSLPNFRLIISDDGSTDETPAILKEYAARDDRIIHMRTPRRLGYIGNARRCFELARKQFPSTEYFAWASDHDIWHPRWLEVLALALDECIASMPTEKFSQQGRYAARLTTSLSPLGGFRESSPKLRRGT